MKVSPANAAGAYADQYFSFARLSGGNVGEDKRIRFDRRAGWKDARFHVRNRARKYSPASEKITSGDHAATCAGNWLKFPTCSNNCPIDQYAIAMMKLRPTPAIAPRLPARNANGIETIAMISANSGTENFL